MEDMRKNRESSYYLLYECHSMATLRQSVIGKLFSDLKDIRNIENHKANRNLSTYLNKSYGNRT